MRSTALCPGRSACVVIQWKKSCKREVFPVPPDTKLSLSNTEVAKKLLDIRMLMELAGEPFYKYTAFERAAATLENAAPVADIIAAGELLKLPGIGKSIGGTIEEIVNTGTAQALEELHKRFPPTIFEVLGVSGIGVKTAALLFENY